tara:strand:+ start:102 stop:317 length:216 start_codon:yes stop_codon:yes gene_type:complete
VAKLGMESFLVRLCSVVHWIAFLITCLFMYVILTGESGNPFLLNFIVALIPNTLGWLIKYIFTGNGKFLPF